MILAFLLANISTAFVMAAPKPIQIGLIIPETRQDKVTENPWGIQQRRGFELALAGAKALSWKVKNNAESAILAREKALEYIHEKVDVIAGLNFSDHAVAVKQQTEPAMIPYLTVFASSEGLFDKSKTVFGMVPTNEVQSDKIVKYLAGFPVAFQSGVGLIVARNCEYCVDMERIIKKRLQEKGIQIHQYSDILRNRPISQEYLEKQAFQKLMVILAYEVEGLSLIDGLAKKGFKGVIIGGDAWSVQSLQVSKNIGLIQSLCLGNPIPYDVSGTSEKNQKFVSTYKRRYGEPPTDVAALSYDAGMVLIKASEKCVNSEAIKTCLAEALSKLDLEGVSGRIKFSKNGKRIDSGKLLKSAGCGALEKEYGFKL